MASLPPQRWGQEVSKSDSVEFWTRPNNQECLYRKSHPTQHIQVSHIFASLRILPTYNILVYFKRETMRKLNFGRPRYSLSEQKLEDFIPFLRRGARSSLEFAWCQMPQAGNRFRIYAVASCSSFFSNAVCYSWVQLGNMGLPINYFEKESSGQSSSLSTIYPFSIQFWKKPYIHIVSYCIKSCS